MAFPGWLLISCVSFAGAPAGHDPPADRLAALVEAMDHDEWTVREAATREALDAPGIGLDALEPVIRDPTRPPEARLRVLGIARARFLSRDAWPALGISGEERRFRRRGAVVTPTGGRAFHSSTVLEPGDVVLAIGDLAITGWDHLRQVILSHDPEEVLRLSILRSDEPLEVEVRLGRWEDLGNAGNLDMQTMVRAWEVRAARLSEPARPGAPIESGLDESHWMPAVPEGRAVIGTAVEPRRPPSAASRPLVVMGGETPAWLASPATGLTGIVAPPAR